MKKLIAVLFAATLILSGCKNDNPDNPDAQTTTSAATEAITQATPAPLKDGDVQAIKKLEFTYMPEGAEISYDPNTGTRAKVYLRQQYTIDIEGANYHETLNELPVTAESAMVGLKMNHMIMYSSEVDVEDPKNIKVGKAGYDGISYDYIVHEYEYEHDAEGNSVKDENGNDKRTLIGNLKCVSVYFYSGVDAYSLIFTSAEENFDKFYPEFEKFLAGIEVDENMKAQ